MTQGASLEHCTPLDTLGCDTLKRQENEFSSYLCKQFRKHIHQFLLSERFYFCGDFSRTKDSTSKLYEEKEKEMKPLYCFSNKQCCTNCYHWQLLGVPITKQGPGETCDHSTDCLPPLPQHSGWMLCCWCSMASSSGHPEPLPPGINSCCNKETIMRFKNSGGLVFSSGKLMGGFKFTETFEMEGRRENNW